MPAPLLTPRLRLRTVVSADAGAVHAIHERIALVSSHRGRTLDQVRATIAAVEGREPGTSPGWHQYVIERRDDGLVLGDLGVHFGSPTARQAELAYTLDPAHWGQGLASEAVGALVHHLFTDHALHRLVATTGADNARSRALLGRLGFRLEGLLVEGWWEQATGRWTDECLYALLAREHRSRS